MTPGRRDWHVMAGQADLAGGVIEHARPPLGAHSWAKLLQPVGASARRGVSQVHLLALATATGHGTGGPVRAAGNG